MTHSRDQKERYSRIDPFLQTILIDMYPLLPSRKLSRRHPAYIIILAAVAGINLIFQSLAGTGLNGANSDPGGPTVTQANLTTVPLAGFVYWNAEVEDTDGVDNVQFFVDGTLRQTIKAQFNKEGKHQPSYSYKEPTGGLDTRGLPDGPHTLQIQATDTKGNKTVKDQVATIDNLSNLGLLFKGDFETGDLSQWQAVQRAEDDRIEVVSSPTDGGKYAARFKVHPGDVVEAGRGHGNRAEVFARHGLGSQALTGAWPDPEGSERWYGWSTFFPNDFPVFSDGDDWQLFLQWKNYGAGSPPLDMRLRNNKMEFHTWAKTIERGRWNRFMAHIKWSPDSNVGFVEFWYDGKLVVPKDYTATMRDGECDRGISNYFKIGLYRSSGINSITSIYHDNVRIGTTKESVEHH